MSSRFCVAVPVYCWAAEWMPSTIPISTIEVPAGKFLYGDQKEPREIPYRYWIAKYPVTNLQFKRFMDAGGYDHQSWWSEEGWSWRQRQDCEQPLYWDDHERGKSIFPVVGVSWFEAEAYSNWLNRQLTKMPLANAQLVWSDKHTVRLASEEEWNAQRGALMGESTHGARSLINESEH